MINPSSPDFENTPASIHRPDFEVYPLDRTAEPLVSIITPFYNTGKLVRETEVTIYRQTFQQWEWVIINDASTNRESREVLKQYRNHDDPRIRVIDQAKNLGPSACRNRGVRESRSEFIFPLDSDDLIEPTTLEKCYWYLRSHTECPWVNGWSVGFGSENYIWTHGYHCREKFLEENLVTGRTMIRKSVFEKLGGYEEDIRDGCEDWHFWLKGAAEGIWGHTIPEIFDWYRRRQNHWFRWKTINQNKRMALFKESLTVRFSTLYDNEFPRWTPPWPMPMDEFDDSQRSPNLLAKSEKHLLLILPWLSIGGADKFNLDLVRSLSGRGWKITIITTKPAGHYWSADFAEWTPDIFHLENIVRPIDQPLFIRSIIQSRQPDAVLVSGSELGYWLLPYLWHHCPDVAYLDYTHIEEEYWKNGGYPRYSTRNRDFLELNLVTSNYLKNWMVERGHDRPAQIRTIYINVDSDFWKPDAAVRRRIREEEGYPEDLPIIFFAGRLSAQKQPEVLAGVAKLLHKSDQKYHFWIAGDGEFREFLESHLRDGELRDCVTMLGNLKPAQILERMQAADIFFLPSLWEGIALSIYEAMSTGLPVVGARVGGQDELVTPDTGILINSKELNPDEQKHKYAELLIDLISDRERRVQLGDLARKRIEKHFSLKQMVDNMEASIQEAIRLHSRRKGPEISAAFAHETAIRAIEYFRIEKVADHLWIEANRISGS